jgi:L-rhamnose mutarotase
MKRVGFQFKVRQDRLADYKEHHKNVWPGDAGGFAPNRLA